MGGLMDIWSKWSMHVLMDICSKRFMDGVLYIRRKAWRTYRYIFGLNDSWTDWCIFGEKNLWTINVYLEKRIDGQLMYIWSGGLTDGLIFVWSEGLMDG